MFFKFLEIFFLASLKYVFTVPVALLIGMDLGIAVLAILLGGMGGFLFFYYIPKPLIRMLCMAGTAALQLIPAGCRPVKACNNPIQILSEKKIRFNNRNRTIVKIRRRYGMWGLVVTTPVFLSIPVGAFLAGYYYPGKIKVVIYMLLSICIWGLLFSVILSLFPGIMH